MRNLPKSPIFLCGVVLLYGVLYLLFPEKMLVALRRSGSMFANILIPLGLVFLILFFINLFINPGQVVRLFGKRSGVKGVFFATVAGILSMGPIYAWYPLLKELRQKGAKDSLLAIFLGNRAVKPFLMPIMISYFGLHYVLILTLFTIGGSLALGSIVGALVKNNQGKIVQQN
jgi:uncharacterized membrane protein YraQ (UPF0718 family)